MEFLRRQGKYAGAPRPDIILLDLNLPRRTAARCWRRSRTTTTCKRIPVVVLTTSKAEEDVLRTYNLHANCYVTKPVDLEKFIVVVKSIDALLAHRRDACRRTAHERRRARHNVLLIEDNPGDARLIQEMLAEDPDAPFALHCADRLSRGLEHLSAGETGLVLLDLSLPDSHGPRDLRQGLRALADGADHRAHRQRRPDRRALGGEGRRAGLPGQGPLDRELLLRSMQYSIERKRYQVQLEHQANYDALTGLPNRNLLHDRLRQAVYSQRRAARDRGGVHRPRPLQVRQRQLGHTTGDELLKAHGRAPARACCARATPWRASAATSSC